MHWSDGNLWALNRHLAEIEDYDANNPPDMYCGRCDVMISAESFPHHIADNECPDCGSELYESKEDYEPSEAQQGLIPIPDGYDEP